MHSPPSAPVGSTAASLRHLFPIARPLSLPRGGLSPRLHSAIHEAEAAQHGRAAGHWEMAHTDGGAAGAAGGLEGAGEMRLRREQPPARLSFC